MKLEPDGIVAEPAARQPHPFDLVLAFLDVLLRFAALIVEGDHPLGWSGEIGDDKANTGIQFARMPFYLGHNAPLSLPASCLITETGVIAPHIVRRATDRAGEQMGDAFLKNRVGFDRMA